MPANSSPYAAFAFDVLISSLNKQKTPTHNLRFYKDLFIRKFSYSDDINHDSYPLFVTWNIIEGNLSNYQDDEHELRGCIGCFSNLPLEKGLIEYSKISAFEDPRFEPIEKRELNRLLVSITLLKDFEVGLNPLDWKLGENGIKISFVDRGSKKSATFLPDVPVEQDWDKETTLNYLVQKAGVSKYKVNYKKFDIKLTKYKGDKSSMSYKDYLNLFV
ncbi:uncharacterized protein ASCRUDRAFT_34342 [Ascoidea rubescens DSM 1968]|uniref:AMMECR1 domain-containing protein n=1 Tax=Ascoidea rubescens DSM 1968 TaxID=1344418 RepID=A0A1D2VJB5_9ASCO|nr:hypothetical protein ASCRUDRAFT_34342 [Ascoidea rubescens DSM 1968]ODV61716.1 hypothetical protein ASCRUDRAFT_34342 [Ascoidea rubescens DSM 1968]